jgi:hypothetical protein
MLTAAATTHSVNNSRDPVRVTCHSNHGMDQCSERCVANECQGSGR